MHYGKKAFAKDRNKATIEQKNLVSDSRMGQRKSEQI